MKAKIGLAIAKGDVSAFTPAIRTLLHGRGYDLKLPLDEERLQLLEYFEAIADIRCIKQPVEHPSKAGNIRSQRIATSAGRQAAKVWQLSRGKAVFMKSPSAAVTRKNHAKMKVLARGSSDVIDLHARQAGPKQP